MAFKLGELFVEFTTKGVDSFRAGIGQVKAGLEGIQQGVQAVSRLATIGFAAASATLLGFTRAGINASGMGQLLSFQMERLSRNVAGLFSPEIKRVIGLIEQLNNWFSSLTDAQRENIVRWIEGAAAGLAVAMVLPKVFAGVALLTQGIYALATAITAGLSSTGIGALLPLLGAAVGGLTALTVGVGVASGGFGRLWEAMKPVLNALKEGFTRVLDALEPAFNALSGVFQAFADAMVAIIPTVVRIFETFAKVSATILEALAPALVLLAEAWASIMDAAQPVIDAVMEFVVTLAEVLKPVIQIVAMIGKMFLQMMRPIIAVIAQVVSLIVRSMIPALKLLLAVLTPIAKLLAFITGTKLDLSAPKFEKKVEEERGALAPKLGGMEALDKTWERIALASRQIGQFGGKNPEEQQIDLLTQIRDGQRDVKDSIDRMKPAVVR